MTGELFYYINMLLLFCGFIVGALSYVANRRQATSNVQDNAINALRAQIIVLKEEVERLAAENYHLLVVQQLIVETLEKNGIELVIEKTGIVLTDEATHRTRVTFARPDDKDKDEKQ